MQMVKSLQSYIIYNLDSLDFMNEETFQLFILNHTNDKDPPQWDVLDETGSQVIEHIIEDEDQGPSKEWGPYG